MQPPTEPGPELLRYILGALRLQGTSLHRTALELRLKNQNARAALLGTWKGRRARCVVQILIEKASQQVNHDNETHGTTVQH